MKFAVPLGLALSLFASTALAAQPVTITDPGNQTAAKVDGSGNLQVNCTTGCGSGVITGNQSNAGAGTTGSANVGTNSYTYLWNGSSWQQGLTGTQTAAASVAVTINPNGVTTTPTGYTVTTANTFQSVLAASATRKGCLLQNTNAGGGDVEYVFFGSNASATKGASIQVAPGGAVNCATGSGQVLTDNVSVTSVASGTDTGIVNAQ
jgi:hypothetical protein